MKKILQILFALVIILSFTSKLNAQSDEQSFGLGFIPSFIEGKNVFTKHNIVAFDNTGINRFYGALVRQTSYDEQGSILDEINFASIVVQNSFSYYLMNFTKSELIELKNIISLLEKEMSVDKKNRDKTMAEYKMRRNSNPENLVSFKNDGAFLDLDSGDFIDKVSFIEYDEIVCEIGYRSRFSNSPATFFDWYFFDAKIAKKDLDRTVNKLIKNFDQW